MDAAIPPNMAQLGQEPAEPQDDGGGDEMAEAQRALDGIKIALYQDPKSSDQFLGMIKPEKKEDSLVRAAILLVTELDKKMDLDETVLAPMTVMAAGELMELAEAGLNLQFSEMEQKRIVMAAFEGILQAYDVNPQEAADVIAEVGPEAEQQGLAEYQTALTGMGA